MQTENKHWGHAHCSNWLMQDCETLLTVSAIDSLSYRVVIELLIWFASRHGLSLPPDFLESMPNFERENQRQNAIGHEVEYQQMKDLIKFTAMFLCCDEAVDRSVLTFCTNCTTFVADTTEIIDEKLCYNQFLRDP